MGFSLFNSKSSSSSSSRITDASVKENDGQFNIGGGNDGDLTIVNSNDLGVQTTGAVAVEAVRSGENLARDAIDSVTNFASDAIFSNENVINRGFDTADRVVDFSGAISTSLIDSNRDLYETFADVSGGVQSEAFSLVEKIKTNEQLGEVSSLKELAKIAGLTLVGIALLRKA